MSNLMVNKRNWKGETEKGGKKLPTTQLSLSITCYMIIIIKIYSQKNTHSISSFTFNDTNLTQILSYLNCKKERINNHILNSKMRRIRNSLTIKIFVKKIKNSNVPKKFAGFSSSEAKPPWMRCLIWRFEGEKRKFGSLTWRFREIFKSSVYLIFICGEKRSIQIFEPRNMIFFLGGDFHLMFQTTSVSGLV